MCKLLWFVTLTSPWVGGDAATPTFEMSSVMPEAKTMVVKEGSHITLQCTSNIRWMSCDWRQPGGSFPCPIQHSETSKKCAGDNEWTVKRTDEVTCSVEVLSVSLVHSGQYRCNLQSFPDKDTSKYQYAKESFNVDLVKEAKVQLTGPVTLKLEDGKKKTLTCNVSNGSPWPDISWALDQAPLEMKIINSINNSQGIEETIEIVPDMSWSGQQVECQAEQVDDIGNVIHNADIRNIKVMKPPKRAAPSPTPGVAGTNRDQSFKIDERYPKGQMGQTSTITLRKRASVVFNCSTSSNWMSCTWKSPMSNNPCPLYKAQSDSKKSEDCTFGQTLLKYRVQYEKKGHFHTCSLIGDLSQDPTLEEQGLWNCNLQSYPYGQHDEYYRDQQFFNVELLKPAHVTFKYHKKGYTAEGSDIKTKEAEVYDTEEIELTCTTEGAKPQATIGWYLNTMKIDFDHRTFRDNFKIIEKDGPTKNSRGEFYYLEKIKYISILKHNSHYLQCRSTQVDDENNLEEVFNEDTKVALFIKAIPVPESNVISAEVVGTIIGFIIILILSFLLLAFAWYTRRWCFAVPVVVLGAAKDKDTGEMIIQTDEEQKPLMKDSQSDASFGPPKHSRSRDNIFYDVEKGEVDIQTEANDTMDVGVGVNMPNEKELRKPNFSLDQVHIYDFEGDNKSIISLSSLDSAEDQLDGMDWADTFRSMGTKFTKLAELCDGSDSEEEENEEGQNTMSQRKKAPNVSSDDKVNMGLPKKVGPREVKPVKLPKPAMRNKNKDIQNGAVKLKEEFLKGSSEV